jgi:predicted transport protein
MEPLFYDVYEIFVLWTKHKFRSELHVYPARYCDNVNRNENPVESQLSNFIEINVQLRRRILFLYTRFQDFIDSLTFINTLHDISQWMAPHTMKISLHE